MCFILCVKLLIFLQALHLILSTNFCCLRVTLTLKLVCCSILHTFNVSILVYISTLVFYIFLSVSCHLIPAPMVHHVATASALHSYHCLNWPCPTVHTTIAPCRQVSCRGTLPNVPQLKSQRFLENLTTTILLFGKDLGFNRSSNPNQLKPPWPETHTQQPTPALLIFYTLVLSFANEAMREKEQLKPCGQWQASQNTGRMGGVWKVEFFTKVREAVKGAKMGEKDE